jgi:FkbM family methyltransferase
VVFDVGANYGLYALTLAHALGPAAAVHCFEPNADTAARLIRNISLNPNRNVYAHQVALADWHGTARVIANDTNSGASSLAEGEGALVTTLDRFCEEHQIERLDFLKVDIEGFEPRFLRGGRASLARFRPMMQIELNRPVLLHAGSSAEEVLELLRSLGYEFYLAKRDRLLPMTRLADEPELLVNCFCVHAKNRPAGI